MTKAVHRLHLFCIAWIFGAALAHPRSTLAEELPDITTVPEDLKVPAISEAAPAAGLRVGRTSAGWEGTAVHHTICLPVNWKPGGKFPVLVEFAGNGGFKNNFGDACDGSVEGGSLAYGISGGADFICIAMPYVKVSDGKKENAPLWLGDADETAAYCVATVREVCRDFGGDEKALVLCGFSRGAIACNYIGLRNDTIAPLWRAFICHSHYDGVRTTWPYADADRASALARLQRLDGRPQFISQEVSVEATRGYLTATGVRGVFEFSALPFRNHTDRWALRDCGQRRKVRAWLAALGLPTR